MMITPSELMSIYQYSIPILIALVMLMLYVRSNTPRLQLKSGSVGSRIWYYMAISVFFSLMQQIVFVMIYYVGSLTTDGVVNMDLMFKNLIWTFPLSVLVYHGYNFMGQSILFGQNDENIKLELFVFLALFVVFWLVVMLQAIFAVIYSIRWIFIGAGA